MQEGIISGYHAARISYEISHERKISNLTYKFIG